MHPEAKEELTVGSKYRVLRIAAGTGVMKTCSLCPDPPPMNGKPDSIEKEKSDAAGKSQ